MALSISNQDPFLEDIGQSYAHILCSTQTYQGNRAYKSRHAAVISHYGDQSIEVTQADAQWTIDLRTYHTAIGAWARYHSYTKWGVPASQMGPEPHVPAMMPIYGGALLDANELPLATYGISGLEMLSLSDESTRKIPAKAGDGADENGFGGPVLAVRGMSKVPGSLSKRMNVCKGARARKAARNQMTKSSTMKKPLVPVPNFGNLSIRTKVPADQEAASWKASFETGF